MTGLYQRQVAQGSLARSESPSGRVQRHPVVGSDGRAVEVKALTQTPLVDEAIWH
jgi:hypothetical protein